MINEFCKVISKELMLLRKSCDMSNDQLAKKTGLSTSTISRYESGKNNMNLDIIEKIVVSCNSNMNIFFESCIAKMQQKNYETKE